MRYAPVVRFYGVLRKSNADVFADKADVLTLFCRFRAHKQPLVAGEKHFVFLGLRHALFDVGGYCSTTTTWKPAPEAAEQGA